MPAVSEEFVRAAAKYEDNPELVSENLVLLREWLTTQPHLPEVPDDMLKVFHHSCYYDLDQTKLCMEHYYTLRSNIPGAFNDRDLTRPGLAQSLEVLQLAALPVPDPRGYRIMYAGLKDPDPSKYLYLECNALFIMTMDSCFHRYGPMPGFIHIHDMKGAKLGHLTRSSFSLMKKFLQYNQDAHPIRLKEIHVINVVPWVDKILTICKPFMKKEVLKKLHFHVTNSETLYDHLPPKCLPADLGGTLPPIAKLHDETVEYLKTMKDFFAEEEAYRVDESRRGHGKSAPTPTID